MRRLGDCTDLKLLTDDVNGTLHETLVHKSVIAAVFPFIDEILDTSTTSLNVTRYFGFPFMTDAMVEFIYDPDNFITYQQNFIRALTLDVGPEIIKLFVDLRHEIPVYSSFLRALNWHLVSMYLITPDNYIGYMRLAQQTLPELQDAASFLTNTAIADSSVPVGEVDTNPSHFKNIGIIHRKKFESYQDCNVVLVDLETMQTFAFGMHNPMVNYTNFRQTEILALGIDHFGEKSLLVAAYNDSIFDNNAVLLKYCVERRRYITGPLPILQINSAKADPYMYIAMGDKGSLAHFSIVPTYGGDNENTDQVTCYCSRLSHSTGQWKTEYGIFPTNDKIFKRVEGATSPPVLRQFIISQSSTKKIGVVVTKCHIILCIIRNVGNGQLVMSCTWYRLEFNMTPEIASTIRYATYNNGDVLFGMVNDTWYVLRSATGFNDILPMSRVMPAPDFLSCDADSDKLLYLCKSQDCDTGPHLYAASISQGPEVDTLLVTDDLQTVIHLGHEELQRDDDKNVSFHILPSHTRFFKQIQTHDAAIILDVCDAQRTYKVCEIKRNMNPEFREVILKNVTNCKAKRWALQQIKFV